VTSNEGVHDVADPDYVYVDWGSDFANRHGGSFPEFSTPGLFVGLGPLALEYIAQAGGAGYFRRSSVEPHLATGRLRLVPDAPEFTHPVYAVYSDCAEVDVVGTALDGLRELAAARPT
jgi:DNA-binding transcriptional LysR family regulator